MDIDTVSNIPNSIIIIAVNLYTATDIDAIVYQWFQISRG